MHNVGVFALEKETTWCESNYNWSSAGICAEYYNLVEAKIILDIEFLQISLDGNLSLGFLLN